MPISALPPEILDDITDWLAEISGSSLSDLAASSRHFTHRSQSHLFNAMNLTSDNFEKKLAMLETHPTLFRFIRTLVIEMGSTWPITDDDGGSEFQVAILSLLDHLRCITTLEILFSKTYGSNNLGDAWARWETVSSSCRDVVTKAIRVAMPTLEALGVRGLRNIPIHTVQSLPCLKSLVLEKATGFSKDGAMPGALAPPNLVWLSCHRTGITSLPPLLPSFCNILHLSFEVAGIEEHIAVWTVLDTLPRLESLVLDYSNRVSYSRRNRELSESGSLFRTGNILCS